MKKITIILAFALTVTNLFSQSTKKIIQKEDLTEEAFTMLSSSMDTLVLIEWIECKPFGQGAKAVNPNHDTLFVFYSPKSTTKRPQLDFYYEVDISKLDNWVIKDFSKVNTDNDKLRAFENNSRRYKFYLEVDCKPEKKVYYFKYD